MDIINTVKNCAMHPAGLVSCLSTGANRSNFADTSSGTLAGIIIIVLIFVAFWIMSLVATYRLTGSALQVVLCVLFGWLYLFFAWIYYGLTGHKFVKVSKA